MFYRHKVKTEQGKENVASEPDASGLHIPGIGIMRQRRDSSVTSATGQLPRQPHLHGNRPSECINAIEAIVRQAVFGINGRGMAPVDGM